MYKFLKLSTTGKLFLLFMGIFPLIPIVSYGQTVGIVISGVVSDESDSPLPGATVLLEGSSTGVVSDANGKYSITVPNSDAVLVFSSVGYATQEVIVGDHAIIDIVLNEDARALEEVVVVGYGTVKRKDLTGSVSSITGSDIRITPVSDITQAISGKVAGVQVIRSQGSPDAEVSIKIRGGTSITQGNDPLYIIDGFPTEDGLRGIEASDIESIDILKDASSTAIYGSRGANGVVLITTKSGKKNKLNISYDMYAGVKKVHKKYDVLSVEDFVKLEYERVVDDPQKMNDVIIPYYGTYDQYHTLYGDRQGIDWQKEVFENHSATTQQHKISISGGDDNTQYIFSYTHNDDAGVWYKSGLKRDNFRAKFNQKAAEWLDFSANISYINEATKGLGSLQEGGYSSRMQHVIQYRPIMGKDGNDEDLLIDDIDPILTLEGSSQMQSPLASIEGEFNDKRNRILNINGDVTIKFSKALSYRGTVGIRNRLKTTDLFYNMRSKQAKGAGAPYGSKTSTDDASLMFNNVLTYLKTFDRHQLSVLGGQELITQTSKYLRTSATNFPDQNFGLNDMSLASTAEIPITVNQGDKLLSFFGRVNYSYRDKYLLTASFRADGSTKFGTNHKWGYFPSASIAWKITEEDFLKTQNILSDAKVRLSYGAAGNNRIANYLSLSKIGSTWVPVGSGSESGFVSKQLQNPDLRWEKNISANLGFDFALFKDKLQFTVDIYKVNTKDLLLEASIPLVSGYSSTMINAGQTSNKGIEVSIISHNVTTKNFAWTTTLNLSHNKNEIKELYHTDYLEKVSGWAVASEFNKSDYMIRVGEPIGQMWGYVLDGIYTVDDFDYNVGSKTYEVKTDVPYNPDYYPKPGYWKYKDLPDKDGVKDGKLTSDDRTVIANANPVIYGGLTNNFTYKGFDLNIFLNFSIGNKIYSANKMYYTKLNNQYRNSFAFIKNRFTYIDNDGNNVFHDPQRLNEINAGKDIASIDGSSNLYFHSGFVEDGSFLKINNVSLGYTLPKSVLNKIYFTIIRFYVTGYNLYTFTKYSGYDPEVNTIPNNGMTPGNDWGAYPSAKTFVLGANITF
jgi:TonB-linked SusC/RagA family outer membrane protein